MSETDWKQRADALLTTMRAMMSPPEALQAEHLALVNERLDAEGVRGKVWMVMPYRCDRCGSLRFYEAEVGVEGPPGWRADGTYIASAFTAGRCERDGSPMTHVMHRDIVFEEYREPGEPFVEGYRQPGESFVGSGLPTHADKMFRVPREPVQYVTHGCDDDGNVIYSTATHAFLSIPIHAIRRSTAAAHHG